MSNVKHDKKYWEQSLNAQAARSSPFESFDPFEPEPVLDSPVITTLKREPHPGVPTPPYGRASTSLEVIASKVRVLEDKLEDAKKDVLYHKELLLREEIENRSLSDHLQYQLLKADAHRMVWSAREYLGVNYPDSRDAQAILTDVFQELSASGINHRAIRDKYVAEKKSRQVYFTDKFKEALKAATPEQFHPYAKAISLCCQKPLKEEIISSILYLDCSACGKLWLCKGPVEGTASDV